ncbi:MAG: hypothetical protein ACTSYL_06345 [Candidatus Thorarchaeota archaeon]
MEDPIGHAWNNLYAANPKIQAFAIIKGSTVAWQTSNWDLVAEAESLSSILKNAPEKIRVNKVEYHRVYMDETSFVATANKNKGHLLMSLVSAGTWLVAWATPDADPELAQIDLAKTAFDLRDSV